MNNIICIKRHLVKNLLIEKGVVPFSYKYRNDIQMYEIELEWLGPDYTNYKDKQVTIIKPKKFIQQEQEEQGLLNVTISFQDEETFKKNWAPIRKIKLQKIMKKYGTNN